MPERPAKRVMLIGWDAADWQFIRPLLERGWMPHLQRMIDGGVMGNLATLQPILSPMLWNSIATGKRADKHEIVSFVEPDGKGGIRPVSSTSRKAKAVWNILSQQGLRSAVVGWFASHPAEPIEGIVLSDRFHRVLGEGPKRYPMDEQSVHPRALIDTIRRLKIALPDITPEQILPFVPEAAKVDQSRDHKLAQIGALLAECSNVHNAATWIAEHESWDLLAVYYDAIDHFGHGFMEHHPPKMPHLSDDEFAIYQHVMTGVYRFHDMMLGRLLQLAGDDTAVMLISDHGFHCGSMRPEYVVDPSDPTKRGGAAMNPLAWHRPYGVFVMRGPGIRADEIIYGASLLDIAPTILALLGQPIPGDMDGRPLTRCFARPIEMGHIETYEPPHPRDGVHRGEQADDPFTAQQAMEQLVALGYIDAPGEDQARTVQKAMHERASNLAQVYFTSARFEQALALLNELRGHDRSPHFLCRLAMCLLSLRRLEEATPLIEQAAREAPGMPLALMLLGQARYAQKRYDEAFALFERAQQADPRLPFLHCHLGRIHLQQKRPEMAEAAFRRALEIDGDSADAHDGMGVALRRQGRLDDALFEHMQSAALLHHRPETHVNLGLTLIRLRDVDWAIRAFGVAAELAPEHPLPQRLLAQAYRRFKKDPASARQHHEKAMRLRRAMRASGKAVTSPLSGP